MAEGAGEVVGGANVDDGHSFAGVEPVLELLRLDPSERVPRERPTHSPDKPRQQGNRREQGKCKQTIAHPLRFAAQRGAAGVSKPSVGHHPGHHEEQGGDDVMPERDAREPQRVVREIEREQRDEPHQGDETPALAVDPFAQSLEAPAGLARTPIRGEVARQQERKGGAERGTQQVPEAAPDRAEQDAAGKAEDRTGNERHRGERVDDDVADRRPWAERAEPSVEHRRIDLLAMKRGQRRRCDEQQRERKARQETAIAHGTPSRGPSGYRPASPRKGWSSMRSSLSSRGSRNCSMPIVMASCPAAGCAREGPNRRSHQGKLNPKLLLVSRDTTE